MKRRRYVLRQSRDTGAWALYSNGDLAAVAINFDAGMRLWRDMWRFHDAFMRGER